MMKKKLVLMQDGLVSLNICKLYIGPRFINMHSIAAASVFFIAQFCTAIMWGRVSDRYGRRPVLLTGLIGNSVSSCLFGLSKNLWWAIGSRALCGIMNGNSGVARSMVSEITDNTNKAKAFSIFGFCWGAGMIGNVFFLFLFLFSYP